MTILKRNAPLLVVTAALLVAGSAREARADTSAERCVAQSDEGQFLRDHGKLLQARASLQACAQAECPAIVRKACAEWLEGVEARLPTIVVTAADPRGKKVAAEVQLDGEAKPLPLETPTPIDPGFHVVQGRVAGRPTAEVKLQVREGEKKVKVELVSPDPPAPGAGRRPLVPTMSWVLGGVAVAGGIVSVAFWQDAVSKGDSLKGSCAPGCTDEEVAPVERGLLVSRIAGGVAIGAAVAAVAWVIVGRRGDDPPAKVRAAGPGLAVSF